MPCQNASLGTILQTTFAQSNLKTLDGLFHNAFFTFLRKIIAL